MGAGRLNHHAPIHRHKVNSAEWTRVLTVREPSMKAGWRDAPLALRDSLVSNTQDVQFTSCAYGDADESV